MSEAVSNMNENQQEVVQNEGPPISPSETINAKLLAAGKAPMAIDQEITFHFKTPRKDPNTGKPPEDPETGQPVKARPSLKLTLPIPTYEAIADMLLGDNEKHKNFIVNTFADLVKQKVRLQVNDAENPVKRQEDLRLDELSLIALAEEEPVERAGRGISKETWADFEEDYIAVMAPLTGRSEEKIKGAAKLLSGKFYQVRTNKKIIEFLEGQLDLWYQNTPSATEFSDLYTYLTKKAADHKNAGEQALLDYLQS